VNPDGLKISLQWAWLRLLSARRRARENTEHFQTVEPPQSVLFMCEIMLTDVS